MQKLTLNLLLLIILLIVFRYLFPIVLPFLLGFSLAFLIKHYLSKHHIITQLIFLLLFYLMLLIIFGLICIIIKQTIMIYEPLVNYYLQQFIPPLVSLLPSIINTLKNITSLCYNLLLIFIFSITCLIEYDLLIKLIFKYLTINQLQLLNCLKSQLFIQLKIMIILAIFTLLSSIIIFTLIKLPNNLALALITTLFDLIPIIGTGIMYIPLIFIFYLNHNYLNMIIVIIGYLLMNIIRNYLEPRLYGKSIRIPNSIMLLIFSITFYFFNIYAIFIIPLFCGFFTYWKIKENVSLFH